MEQVNTYLACVLYLSQPLLPALRVAGSSQPQFSAQISPLRVRALALRLMQGHLAIFSPQTLPSHLSHSPHLNTTLSTFRALLIICIYGCVYLFMVCLLNSLQAFVRAEATTTE